MKNLKLVVLVALIFSVGLCFSQTAPEIAGKVEYRVPEVLQNSDELIAIGNEKVLPYFKHNIKPKETLYSIAKAYGASLQSIIQLNPKLDPSNLKLEAELIVPLTANKFVSNRSLKTEEATEVKYQVQKGQNQFAIAHRIFQIPLADLQQNNPRYKAGISPGDQLLIGWIILDDQKKVESDIQAELKNEALKESAVLVRQLEESPTQNAGGRAEMKLETRDYELAEEEVSMSENELSKVELEKEKEKVKPKRTQLVEIKGKVATKKTANSSGRYVLSSVIPVNTEVEVFNPMSGRSAFAKVIAPLPKGLFTEEVIAILSGSLAEDLRAMDSQFYVYVRYLK